MPAGYQTRYAEIQRLSAEMQSMDRMARLLWETGAPLAEAVREVCTGLKYEVESVAGDASSISVKLDAKRKLLVHIGAAESALEKKSPELAAAFQLVQTVASPDDRVIIVVNTDRLAPPKSRPASVTPEAATLLGRIGVNILPAPTLFALWSMSQQDPQRARVYMERLHAQDGGTAPALP
jgi:hypothetical protein